MARRFFRIGGAVLALLLLSAPSTTASVVIHDGAPGAVAVHFGSSNSYILDSNGLCWSPHSIAPTWSRAPQYDAPIPVSEIKLWEAEWYITMDNGLWMRSGTGAYSFLGQWPGSAVNIEESTWGQIKARYGEADRNVKEEE